MQKIKKSTYEKINAAIVRIEKNRPRVVQKGRSLTIAAVAEEAGYSRATIYRYYPEIRDKIRSKSGRALAHKHGESNKALKNEREKNRNLRKELQEMREKFTKLASINASLTFENRQLKASNNAKNVTTLPQK